MSIQVESTTDAPEVVTATNAADLAKGKVESSQNAASEKKDENAAKSASAESDAKKASKPEPEDDEFEGEGGEDEGEEDSDDADDSDPKNKSKNRSGFKRRVRKLNRQVTETARDRDYWRNEALKLRGQVPQTEQQVQEKPTDHGAPKMEDFETVEEYDEARIDYLVQKRLDVQEQKDKQKAQQTQKQTEVSDFQKRVAEFKGLVDDYEEVIEDCDVELSLTMQDLIVSSENGPELLYELAKDPNEFEKMCRMNPLNAAKAFGRFEAKFQKSQESSKREGKGDEETQQTNAKKKTTNAPPPITPIHGSKSGSRKSIYDANLDQKEFEKLREEQIRARQG